MIYVAMGNKLFIYRIAQRTDISCLCKYAYNNLGGERTALGKMCKFVCK